MIYATLVAVTLAVYWPARHYDFVNYDDTVYVYENSHVLHGLNREGIVWAFAQVAGEHTYWHPLTWLSLMLDTELFGPGPGARHLVNVLFHAANAVLLFLLLWKMTGAVWRSAMVAALFAWHPLQVDTVAWIAERKNVLSTFFWLLTLLAYVRYVKTALHSKSSARRFTASPVLWYLLTLVWFALGLMCKPMLVTTPLLLLILDFWPLDRMRGPKWGRLLVEKIPLFALSGASAVITVVGHQQLGSLVDSNVLSMPARLANALVSYGRYLRKMVWPTDLAVLYPHPGNWPVLTVTCAGLLLAGVTWWAAKSARRRPWLLAGWLWFLVTLLPVIGIIQASGQSMADRFAYVPLVGMFIMLVWLAVELLPAWPGHRVVAAILAGAALVVCLAATSRQLRFWQNSEALFRHALRVTGGNDIMHYNLACALARVNKLDEAVKEFGLTLKLSPSSLDARINLGVTLQMQGKKEEALAEFKEVLRRNPAKESAHNNFGTVLQEQGKLDEAVVQFNEALRLKPEYAEAHNNLGIALSKQGKTNESVAQFAEALKLRPDYDDAHFNLGQILLNEGKPDDAARHFAVALQQRPTYAEAHYQMGVILAARKQTREAIAHYREAIRLKPGWLEALNNLAWILATHKDEKLRNGSEAVRLATQAVTLTKTNNAGALDTLAAACAEAGQWEDAAKQAEKARALAVSAGDKPMADQIQARRQLYQSGKPYRE